MKRCSALAVFFIFTTATLRCAEPSPKFSGSSIPVPPLQVEEWTQPETKLSPLVVKAIGELFNEGLADPRGCQYREIEVAVGSCWSGDCGVTKTAGWVLSSSETQKFAVCWNGLVYPLVSMGEVADLDRDVERLLKKDREQIEKQNKGKKASDHFPLRWDHEAVPEATGIARDSIRPLKAAMLLRLGKTEMAEQVWSQYFVDSSAAQIKDPYLQLASAWVFSLFDRAVCAHMRGDDHLALASVHALVPIQQAIEKEAAARSFPRPSSNTNQDEQTAYLSFLDQLPALVSDQERRGQESAYTPVLEMTTPPSGTEKVANLIRDLELVSARQSGQPGGVDLASDPVVKALILEGDTAVESLLACLEKDTRLTRSVHFWRDFSPSRTILGVHEAAYVALAGILRTSFFESRSTGDSLTAQDMEGRKRVAADIRAYWLKYKGVPLQERWYETLNNDKASPDEWLQAATNIVEPSDINRDIASNFGASWTAIPSRKAGEIPPMKGESLRAKTNPSVSDLLLKRMKFASAQPEDDWDNHWKLACRFALALGDWDGKAYIENLLLFSEAMRQRQIARTIGKSELVNSMVSLYEKRFKLGDERALKEYGDWIVGRSPVEIEGSIAALAPIWRYYANSSMIQAATKMFNSQRTAWAPILQGNNPGGFAGLFTAEIFTTPLVGMEAFESELFRGLADQGKGGEITIGENHMANFGTIDSWGSSGYTLNDPLVPAPGSVVPFRICDLYAYELSALEGFPKIQLYWPVKKRNETVAACIEFLQHYGRCYTYFFNPSFNDPFHDLAHFHIQPLDHPATSDEVKQGRAIFSLKGVTRVCKSPLIPLAASWITLKDSPNEGQQLQPDGSVKKVVVYSTEGWIWQAEELLVGGKWQRFYGYVGPHHLEKVPAAEIEFPVYGWTQFDHGWDCQINGPEVYLKKNEVASVTKLGVRSPLPITVMIRNRSGVDQTVPGQWIQPKGDSKHLPEGVTIALFYSPKRLDEPSGPRYWSQQDFKWENIQLLPGSFSASVPGAPQTLKPTENVAAFQVDLRTFSNFSRPGTYRLKVDFTAKGSSGNRSVETIFAIYNR
jgi:hypothetical protein